MVEHEEIVLSDGEIPVPSEIRSQVNRLREIGVVLPLVNLLGVSAQLVQAKEDNARVGANKPSSQSIGIR